MLREPPDSLREFALFTSNMIGEGPPNARKITQFDIITWNSQKRSRHRSKHVLKSILKRYGHGVVACVQEVPKWGVSFD